MSTPDLETLLRTGQVDVALERANQLLAESDDPAVLLEAHLAHARVGLAVRDLEVAEQALDAALELAPGDLATRALLAHLALDREQPERALGHLKVALLDRSPAETRHPMLHQALARLAAGMGDSASVVAELHRALELEPESRALPVALATAMAEAGEVAQALELLRAHCRARPREAAAWRVAASLASEQGGPAAALELLEEAAVALPADGGIGMQLLSAAAASGELERARPHAQRLKQLGASDPELRRALGTYALACNQLDVALNHFEKARGLAPDTPGLRRAHAAVLVQRARRARKPQIRDRYLEQAQGMLEEQLALLPGDLDAATDLGALLLQGDATARRRATEILDQVLATRPDFAPALVNRAALFLAAKEQAQARALAERAQAASAPGSPAHTQAGQILEETGEV